MPVVPFYSSRHPELFAIEQSAMDRPGQVIRALDRLLPRSGRLLDIGAGNGFTAEALSGHGRSVVALEPASEIIDSARPIAWVRAGLASRPPP